MLHTAPKRLQNTRNPTATPAKRPTIGSEVRDAADVEDEPARVLPRRRQGRGQVRGPLPRAALLLLGAVGAHGLRGCQRNLNESLNETLHETLKETLVIKRNRTGNPKRNGKGRAPLVPA